MKTSSAIMHCQKATFDALGKEAVVSIIEIFVYEVILDDSDEGFDGLTTIQHN